MFDTDQAGLPTFHVHSWALVKEFSVHNLLEISKCESCPATKYMSWNPKTQTGKVLIIPDHRN